MPASFTFSAVLWLAEVANPWVFVTVPHGVSDDIEQTASTKGGFGSVRVFVTVGSTTWETSVFPDSKRGAYILPVRKAVRAAESLSVGDEVEVGLDLVEDSRPEALG